jgi:hypothetical protein
VNTERTVPQVLQERTVGPVFAKLFERRAAGSDQQPGAGRIDGPRLLIQNLEGDLSVHASSGVIRDDQVAHLHRADSDDVDVSPGDAAEIQHVHVQIRVVKSVELRSLGGRDSLSQEPTCTGRTS